MSLTSTYLQAQQVLSLQEALDMALANHADIKNARIDASNQDNLIKSTRADYYPQVTLSSGFNDNPSIRSAFLPASFISDLAPNPNAYIPVAFGARFGTDINLSVDQLIYDHRIFFALDLIRKNKELYLKQQELTEIDVLESVAKSYYNVLYLAHSRDVAAENLERLETLLEQNEQLYKNGFIQEVDFNRFELERNKLSVFVRQTQAYYNGGLENLKVLLGIDLDDSLSLTSSLEEQAFEKVKQQKFSSPTERVEYRLMDMQYKLQDINIKRLKANHIPSLFFNINGGFNSGGELSDLENNFTRYLSYGVSFRWTLFDGLRTKYDIAQVKASQIQIRNTQKMLVERIKAQQQTAHTDLENSLYKLEVQKKNVELAKKVYELSKTKYTEGVGSSKDLIEAQNQLAEEELNLSNTYLETHIFGINYLISISNIDFYKK